jgi:hypothetical protein
MVYGGKNTSKHLKCLLDAFPRGVGALFLLCRVAYLQKSSKKKKEKESTK